MENYVPNKTDIDWAKNVVRLLAEGGRIGYPDSQLVYIVSHKLKTLTLMTPWLLDFEEQAELHNRTIIVFGEIGYAVKTPEQAEAA